jgi:hypothetical protein
MKRRQPGDEEENEEAFMKNVQVLVIASLGVALAAACGGSSTTGGTDGGSGSSSGSGSGGSTGSGSGSLGTSGSGSSGAGSGASSGGNVDAGPLTASNDCPNCNNNDICCLTNVGGNVQGTCAANAAACPAGAGAIECAAEGDCNTGQTCCVTGGTATSPASSACVTSCPTGKPGCGGAARDNMDCPGGAAGWACQVIPGTPGAVLGVCVPMEGGAPVEGGADGGGTPDSGDAAPQDGATNG